MTSYRVRCWGDESAARGEVIVNVVVHARHLHSSMTGMSERVSMSGDWHTGQTRARLGIAGS